MHSRSRSLRGRHHSYYGEEALLGSLRATEGRKHREANFQDEVNPCFYHPDLAEPSLESSGKQKCGSQSSGPSNKAEFRHGREQPKNWYTVLDLSSRGGSGVGKMGERLNQYFFFFC